MEMKIKCPNCGMESYNPNDIENKYCGNCHAFLEDIQIGFLNEFSYLMGQVMGTLSKPEVRKAMIDRKGVTDTQIEKFEAAAKSLINTVCYE